MPDSGGANNRVGGLRVVVANGPRSYREAMAAALRALRPALEVTVVGPEGVDEALLAVDPDVVLCSRVTPLVEAKAPIWVDLYPDGARTVVVRDGGPPVARGDLELDDILRLMDRAGRRLALRAGGGD